jgi:hypothetical protein
MPKHAFIQEEAITIICDNWQQQRLKTKRAVEMNLTVLRAYEECIACNGCTVLLCLLPLAYMKSFRKNEFMLDLERLGHVYWILVQSKKES